MTTIQSAYDYHTACHSHRFDPGPEHFVVLLLLRCDLGGLDGSPALLRFKKGDQVLKRRENISFGYQLSNSQISEDGKAPSIKQGGHVTWSSRGTRVHNTPCESTPVALHPRRHIHDEDRPRHWDRSSGTFGGTPERRGLDTEPGTQSVWHTLWGGAGVSSHELRCCSRFTLLIHTPSPHPPQGHC